MYALKKYTIMLIAFFFLLYLEFRGGSKMFKVKNLLLEARFCGKTLAQKELNFIMDV